MMASDLQDLRQCLEAHLQQVAQPRDPDWSPLGHQQVERYIQEQLSKWGSLESFPFEANGRQHCNWILKLLGSRPGRPPILVGAHFDAAPATPGADDNASGVAVLLELARHFAADPAPSPLWLVAFDLEERGMIGSRGLRPLSQTAAPTPAANAVVGDAGLPGSHPRIPTLPRWP
jgi:acetylornithine deacetylase/succinyl-diaminopimelate desuccinylase-like protein